MTAPLGLRPWDRWTPDRKLTVVLAVLEDECDVRQAALACQIAVAELQTWITRYQRFGHAGLAQKNNRFLKTPGQIEIALRAAVQRP